MKSNLVSYIFLILSIILIVILFQVNYAVRQFENEIGLKEKKIKLLKESNKVLFTEFSAHINPDYIKKLSSKRFIFCEKPPVNKSYDLKELKKIKSNKIYFNYNFRFSKNERAAAKCPPGPGPISKK